MGHAENIPIINWRGGKKMKCKHCWRIFHDAEQIKSGNLTFYCQSCLALRKVKKIYEVE